MFTEGDSAALIYFLFFRRSVMGGVMTHLVSRYKDAELQSKNILQITNTVYFVMNVKML